VRPFRRGGIDAAADVSGSKGTCWPRRPRPHAGPVTPHDRTLFPLALDPHRQPDDHLGQGCRYGGPADPQAARRVPLSRKPCPAALGHVPEELLLPGSTRNSLNLGTFQFMLLTASDKARQRRRVRRVQALSHGCHDVTSAHAPNCHAAAGA
jgi:hypothetical protein